MNIAALLTLAVVITHSPASSRSRLEDPTVAPWAREAFRLVEKRHVVTFYDESGTPNQTVIGGPAATRYDTARGVYSLLGDMFLMDEHNPAVLSLLSAISSTALPRPKEAANDVVMKDLDTGHYYYLVWDRALSHGIIKGYPDQYFRGKRSITRGELAVIAARLLSRVPNVLRTEPAWFKDITGGEWWCGAAVVAAGAGVMSGYPDGSFRGAQPATRNELIVILARMMELASYSG
jgi:hypothetical protein